MKHNANIRTSLCNLLWVMDAKATLNIFIFKGEDTKEELLESDKVYNLLANSVLTETYGNYQVIGLAIALNVTSVLIKEA